MPDDKKIDVEAKRNALLEKRNANQENRGKLEKLAVGVGIATILTTGNVQGQDVYKNTSPTQDKNKISMVESASKDSIFDKQIDKMTADFDEMMKSMDNEFKSKTSEMEKDVAKESQKPERTTHSMMMRGGLIVGIEDKDGNEVAFKQDRENDEQTRNILDQVIKNKITADNRYSHSFVMQDVAQMVYDLNNNPAEFDKAVNRQMKGVKTRTEKDGSTSFIYANKDGQSYNLGKFSKEVSDKNPAIKRIQMNESMNQKNMEKTR